MWSSIKENIQRVPKPSICEILTAIFFNEINDNNEVAIAAITEKLSEITILAEQLDNTLCGFKFAMESDNIKKLLESTNSSQDWHQTKSTTKNSPEGSSKSDDDFITVSECTGTPPSRASSFHTASEGEPTSPWWEVDPSNSSENELDTQHKSRVESKQSSEELCTKIVKEITETRKIKLSHLGCTETRQTVFHGSDRKQIPIVLKPLENLSLLSPEFGEKSIPVQKYADGKISKNNISNLLPCKDKDLKVNMESQNVKDSLCYHERIMKQAITGVF